MNLFDPWPQLHPSKRPLEIFSCPWCGRHETNREPAPKVNCRYCAHYAPLFENWPRGTIRPKLKPTPKPEDETTRVLREERDETLRSLDDYIQWTHALLDKLHRHGLEAPLAPWEKARDD